MKLVLNPNANEELQKLSYRDILSVKETQTILGICRISVYNLIDHGQLKAFRMGRTYMIPKQELKRFLEQKMLEE